MEARTSLRSELRLPFGRLLPTECMHGRVLPQGAGGEIAAERPSRPEADGECILRWRRGLPPPPQEKPPPA